ncbi:MAG TPA: hypothetical protein V6C57_14550 [Coleofasciculaceae cyanobacterium]
MHCSQLLRCCDRIFYSDAPIRLGGKFDLQTHLIQTHLMMTYGDFLQIPLLQQPEPFEELSLRQSRRVGYPNATG